MGFLERIHQPGDLRKLTTPDLNDLAGEIRTFLVENVSRTGGHLGPNLGVVELTIALHRVFRSPKDHLIFDTGHQSYVHKILTGRHNFADLRSAGGLSGYPSRGESEHDIVENSHASTALSWADGISRADALAGRRDRVTVAVIGDGAMTGGMAWEALNNLADDHERPVIIVVNDNGRSYAPTIGGLAHHLDALRVNRKYDSVLKWGKSRLMQAGTPGKMVFDGLHAMKTGLRDVLRPGEGFFRDLGIKYLGPVDGHDITALEFVLTRAKEYGSPVIVHAITEKGRGYRPAETHVADRFHAVGKIHPETGLPIVPSRFGWTAAFADEIVKIARERTDIVALTAAMLEPVGLLQFSREFPKRVIDVGIAEQHALTSAAGMASAGLHPVVSLYATFLNRAYDQVLMDVALHGEGVTITLDRAGITGNDGASHNGMWDLALMRTIPGAQVAAPRDGTRLRQALRRAVTIDDALTVVRYPKGALGEDIPAIDTVTHDGDAREIHVLARHRAEAEAPHALLVGIGPMCTDLLEAAELIADQGYRVTVVDPLWCLPVPRALIELARDADLVLTVEDGIVSGGVGDAVRAALAEADIRAVVKTRGIPRNFLSHDSREAIAERLGLSARAHARVVTETLASISAHAKDWPHTGHANSAGHADHTRQADGPKTRTRDSESDTRRD